MKTKHNIIILIISLLSLSSTAQIYFGGKIGLNMGTLSTQPKLIIDSLNFSSSSNIMPKASLNIAAIGYIEIGPYISIQPEIVYNRKGLKSRVDVMRQDTINVVGNYNYSFDYIEFPLMLKISLKSEDFDPFIEFGAYYGYMLYASCTEEANYGRTQVLNKSYNSTSNSELFNKEDSGFKIGIGATFPVSQGKLFFSIRYAQGFKNSMNLKTEENNKYNTSYNRVFQISIGYLFEMKSNAKDKIYYY
jgi:hypothetical protein